MPAESLPWANLCPAQYIKAENIAEFDPLPTIGPRKADLLRGEYSQTGRINFVDTD